MKKHLAILAAVTLVCFAGASGLWAESRHSGDAESESMAVLLEGLLLELTGERSLEARFKDHGGGLYSLSVSLEQLGPKFSREQLGAAAKDLTNLHHGHSQVDASATAAVHVPLSSLNTEYNFWWATANLGEETINKTKIFHKGPGKDFKDTLQITHGASTLNIFTLAGLTHTESGAFKSSVKISGAGNSKTKGGCFSQ